MKYLSRILFFILIALSVSSCSPVYKIAHDYKPPTSAGGLTCIKGCQSKLNQCNLSCSRQFNQCSIKARQQAKKLLPGLLDAYPRQLEAWLLAKERYEREIDWYELRLDLYEARRDRYLSRCKKGRKKKHCSGSYYRFDPFPYSRPVFNLPRPKRPTLASETAKLQKLNCSNNCGCDNNYRLCYTSCGGVVNSKKVCIKNCPNE